MNREDADGLQPVRGRLPRPRQHRPARPLAPARSAARSSSPTPPAGWPSTRCRMAAIASILQPLRHAARRSTWCSSSSSTSPPSARRWTTSGVWDETDGFYYDKLVTPDGDAPCRSRSGRWSASSRCWPPWWSTRRCSARAETLGKRVRRGSSTELGGPGQPGRAGPAARRARGSAAAARRRRGRPARRLFAKLFDEAEFLSPYGLRALSAYHRDHPYELDVEGFRATIDYEPAESTTAMFGGNSNWRGPIWFPLNYLLISALERYHRFFGDELTIEYPTGRPAAHPRPDRRRPAPAADLAVPRRAGRAAAVLRLGRPPPARPRLERTTWSSTSTSTATTAPGSAPRTRRAGPGWWPT